MLVRSINNTADIRCGNLVGKRGKSNSTSDIKMTNNGSSIRKKLKCNIAKAEDRKRNNTKEEHVEVSKKPVLSWKKKVSMLNGRRSDIT
jgi:hypothetical protein